jgi:hypothetical protein
LEPVPVVAVVPVPPEDVGRGLVNVGVSAVKDGVVIEVAERGPTVNVIGDYIHTLV